MKACPGRTVTAWEPYHAMTGETVRREQSGYPAPASCANLPLQAASREESPVAHESENNPRFTWHPLQA